MPVVTALYRKYRPQTFEEVIGQEHVVRTLKNAILQDRVRQAYVFAGPRGTGKTSLARILAKALNCDQSPIVTPCGTCESCTAVAAGSSLDVIEMDAASQRGIDDVRDIRDRAILQPIARNKVYILDEAHQLTKDAFNALLKLIEEPPPHLVFVFCTTELDKMLPTVRSRCQTFPFSRPRLSDIQPLLRRIADAEKLEAPDPALAQIAHHSRGSYRDAVSTLDQLAASTGGQITISAVRDVLGTIEQDSLFRIVDLLIDGDTAALLNSIEELSERGHDLARLVSDLLEHLRHLLLLQHLTDIPDSLPIEEDSHQRIRSQATAFGEARVLRLIDLLAAALEGIRQGGDPRLPLELALVKISRPETDVGRESILLRLERLETAAPPGLEQASGAEAHAGAAAKESDAAAVAGTVCALDRAVYSCRRAAAAACDRADHRPVDGPGRRCRGQALPGGGLRPRQGSTARARRRAPARRVTRRGFVPAHGRRGPEERTAARSRPPRGNRPTARGPVSRSG